MEIEDIHNAHIVESRSAKFQRYYFEIIYFNISLMFY